MTPHELINLPYAGMARAELIAQGKWSHTITDAERLEWIASNVTNMSREDHKQTWRFKTEYSDYDPDFFREDIDDAAAYMEANT